MLEPRGISVFAVDERGTSEFRDWRMHEISLVDDPIQRGAEIQKCWTQSRVVRLDRDGDTIYFDTSTAVKSICQVTA